MLRKSLDLNCTIDENFTYSVALTIEVGQNSERCDLGAYFGLDGVNAATGAFCLVHWIVTIQQFSIKITTLAMTLMVKKILPVLW